MPGEFSFAVREPGSNGLGASSTHGVRPSHSGSRELAGDVDTLFPVASAQQRGGEVAEDDNA